MTPALTGDVRDGEQPRSHAISAARDAVAEDLATGALVVSARQVKLLLEGFDMLVQHVANAHKNYEADCNRIVALRLGAVMDALGAESVTLSETTFQSLRDKRASLNNHASQDGKSVTYTLSYPEAGEGA